MWGNYKHYGLLPVMGTYATASLAWNKKGGAQHGGEKIKKNWAGAVV